MKLTAMQIEFRKRMLFSTERNMAETALYLHAYFEIYPNATQEAAAKWYDFKNQSSGRKKVSRAMKLLEADSDLFDGVLNNTIAYSKATKVMR